MSVIPDERFSLKPSIQAEINDRRYLIAQKPINTDTLNAIRNKARSIWQENNFKSRSTNPYNNHYVAHKPPPHHCAPAPSSVNQSAACVPHQVLYDSLNRHGCNVSSTTAYRNAASASASATLPTHPAHLAHHSSQSYDVFKHGHSAMLSSYNTHYQNLFDSTDPASANSLRPASPTRVNRPHPSNIFLVTRLHQPEGYSQRLRRSATTPNVFNEDSFVGVAGDSYANLNAHHHHHTNSHDVDVVSHETGSVSSLHNRARPKTAAAASCSASSSSAAVPLSATRRHHHSKIEENSTSSSRDSDCENTEKRQQNFPLRYEESSRGCYGFTRDRPQTAQLGDFEAKKTYRKLIYHRKLFPRGDYLIHPGWPPTIKHHSLNR